MSRKIAREVVMKLLYEREISGEDQEESFRMLEQEFKLNEKDKEYVYDILTGAKLYQQQLDDYISKYSRGWNINRIAKVDLAILRLALYEIIHRDDIPPGVSINEAVELAKKYGGHKTSSFINGILGSFIRNENICKVEEPKEV